MTRKFKISLDSGANIHSAKVTEITLDELGIESEEWDVMSEEEKNGMHERCSF